MNEKKKKDVVAKAFTEVLDFDFADPKTHEKTKRIYHSIGFFHKDESKPKASWESEKEKKTFLKVLKVVERFLDIWFLKGYFHCPFCGKRNSGLFWQTMGRMTVKWSPLVYHCVEEHNWKPPSGFIAFVNKLFKDADDYYE